MIRRLALSLLLLPALVLAGCGKSSTAQDAGVAGSGDQDTASAAVPAMPSAGDIADAQKKAAELDAIRPDALAIVDAAAKDAASAPAPVEGTDYTLIENGQPFDPAAGKVEVVEMFGYVCPACNAFQPVMNAWESKLPADVRFTYVPALFGGPWDLYARAYYAADALGVEKKTHNALFNAIHTEHRLKGEQGQDTPQDLAAFYALYGVDPKTFLDTLNSFSIDAKLNRAKQFSLQSGVQGTPTLIVNGKYLVKANNYQNLLRITDQLVDKERSGAK